MFVLEGDQAQTEILGGVFAIDADSLPAGIVALLGVSDIRRLGLSLDYRSWPRPHRELFLPTPLMDFRLKHERRPAYPAFPSQLFEELKARASSEQHARTVQRIKGIYANSPPAKQKRIVPPPLQTIVPIKMLKPLALLSLPPPSCPAGEKVRGTELGLGEGQASATPERSAMPVSTK
jgi:hypothetical protein